jgi:DNA polymerase-3 subunit delta
VPLKFEQLEAQLQRGLSPVYLIAGPELLLVQEGRDAVLRAAAAAGFEEREVIEVDQRFDWDRLGAASAAPSLFASRRVLDLRLPTGKPGRDGGKVLSEWAAQPDPDTLLVVSCEQWDASSRKAKWAQAMDRAGTRVDIWPIRPAELPRWIAQRMQQAGLAPDREAVMVLAERLEGNLLAAQQEIDKLALSKGQGPVSAQDVLDAVATSARFDAFLLLDRILEGNLADGLRIALGLRRTGVPIQMITGALASGLRTVEAYRQAMAGGENEAAVFRRLNVWQSRQGALRGAARRLNGKRLAEAWSRLSELDRQSKGRASGDPWHSLDRLVVRLAG